MKYVRTYNTDLERRRHCGDCPMYGKPFVGIDTFDGFVQPVNIMFIGLNPGREEAEEGLPFVGKAGRFLRQTIAAVGLTSWMMANSILCSTPNEAAIVDADKARRCCRANLAMIFRDFAPRLIVPLGNGAWSIFATGIPISKAQTMAFASRGRSGEAPEILVLPLTHPSALIRNGGNNSRQYPQFYERLVYIGKVAQNQDPLAAVRESGAVVKECFQRQAI